MTTVTVPSAPALASVPGVPIVATGTWQLSTGPATFTPQDLLDAIAAAQCPAVRSPIIKIGHVDPRFDGEPAVGRVANMRLNDSGQKILGDYTGMPGWLGEVIASAWPDRSIEGSWGFTCQMGHDHPFVITAVALLGVTPPGVGSLGSLADVAALYGVAAAKSVREMFTLAVKGAEGMPEPTHVHGQAAVTSEDIRRAYYDEPGVTYSMWVTEVQIEPLQLIVVNESTGDLCRVPVTLNSDGSFEFGDPVEVEIQYADIAAAKAATAALVAAAVRAGIGDRQPPPGAASHASMSGKHTHTHTAMGAQGSDKTHTHAHTHDGDASHDHPKDHMYAAWSASTNEKNLGTDPSKSQLSAMYALPADTKSDSKLPHHTVSSDGTVGAANTDGCSAAIAAINGGRGGLKGVSAADKKKAYNHLAKHLKDAGKEPPEFTGAAPPPRKTARGAADMFSDEQLAELRKLLGKPDDHELTAEEVIEGMTALAAAAAAKPNSGTAGDAPGKDGGKKDGDGEPAATPLAASVKMPAGVVALDQGVYEEMQRKLARADRFRVEQQTRERDAHIAAAVKAGKFPKAREKVWLRMWDADPAGTREILGSLPENLVPVTDIGTPGGDQDLASSEFDALFPPVYKREPVTG